MILWLGVLLFLLGGVISWSCAVACLVVSIGQVVREEPLRLSRLAIGIGCFGLILLALSLPALIVGYTLQVNS